MTQMCAYTGTGWENQSRVVTRVSGVETLLCLLETLVTRVRTRLWQRKAHVMWIVNLKTHMRTRQLEPNQWGQMSGSWSEAFFSSIHCVRAYVINTIFLWAGSNEYFLPNKAEICSIIVVSVRAFVFPPVSQQGRWKLARYRDTPTRWTSAPDVVAGQRLVAGLRLAAGQRLVAGLRVGVGQRLFVYLEGSLFRLYWKCVYGSSEWRPKFGLMRQIEVKLEFSNDCFIGW